MSPDLGFYFYLYHYRKRLSQRLKKKNEQKQTLRSFFPFFISRLAILLYCLEKLSGRNNANISQASSVTVCVIIMLC